MLRCSTKFVSWEERMISPEKGKRLVHYILKNANEEEILAVVGTEKSPSHMLYVIAEVFHQVYGCYNFINPNTKWRARRDVVHWLTSMVARHSGLTTAAMGSQQQSNVDVSELELLLPNNMVRASSRLKAQGSKIVLSGASFTCDKQLKHYPAFRRNKTTIAVHSFVFVLAKGGSHYVGYLEDLYEDGRGKKKANVRWFMHSRKIKGINNPPEMEFDPREILITPHVEAVSVDSIQGFAIVLKPTHYEKSLGVISLDATNRVHMCCRQIVDDGKVKPFSICSLHGYYCQSILACLDWPRSIGSQLNESGEVEKEEEVQPAKKLKIKFRNGGERSIDIVKPTLNYEPFFKSGQRIEVLCQDSGLRGCWFRCSILKASPKHLKIQYVDIMDAENDSTPLEERIPARRVALPDKLGMRVEGRPTIRPYLPVPPNESADVSSYEIGTAVDAWWCDAWWEGIVIGLGQSITHPIVFYIPGENQTLNMEFKDLRISRDWVGEKWVEIMPKKDILACISSSAANKPNTGTGSVK